jgi:hypothetical protein
MEACQYSYLENTSLNEPRTTGQPHWLASQSTTINGFDLGLDGVPNQVLRLAPKAGVTLKLSQTPQVEKCSAAS